MRAFDDAVYSDFFEHFGCKGANGQFECIAKFGHLSCKLLLATIPVCNKQLSLVFFLV